MWKPRSEYKTLQEQHVPILTRCKPVGQQLGTGPMVVIWTENGPSPGGHFYPCPSVPIFYGNHQFGMMIHDHFDEWMEIPKDLVHKAQPNYGQELILSPWEPISDEMQKGLELAAYICNMYSGGELWAEAILSKSEQIRGQWWMEYERRTREAAS